jgi:hypothetical protein
MITLATLPQATEQEVFDQVVKFMLDQGKKSVKASGACRYRAYAEDGSVLKCAVGCLMSDEEYDADMEGRTWSDNLNKRWQFKILPSAHHRLLNDLQKAHDGADVQVFKEEFKSNAKQIARIYKLKFEGE